MMKKCKDDCEPLCDFCVNYRDNAKGDGFDGDGYCTVKGVEVEAIDSCEDDFVCVLVDGGRVDT